MLSNWKILNKYREYDARIFTLFKKEVKSEGLNRTGHFYTLEVVDWINVIAIDKAGDVILVKQYRHGTEANSLEVPGGAVDASDTDPLEAAQRELMEETGYTSDKWTLLGKVSANPAIMNNFCYCYVAEECEKTHPTNMDAFEEIEIEKYPQDKFLNLVRIGEIHHSLAVAATGLWKLHLER